MTGAAIAISAALCLLASPYLARLTLSAPDREDEHWLRGRPASRNRVAITAVTATALGALAGAGAGWTALLPAYVALALAGAPLTVIDFEHHRLPNRLTYPAAVATAVLLAVAALVRHDWTDYLRAGEAAAAVYAVLFLVSVIGTFGRGDVKLGAILGAFLGWQDWVTVYYGIFAGFVLGTVVALALLATRKASMKTALAFGPMLLVGALTVLAFDLTPTFVG